MKENFAACLAVVLKWEGGYVNNPHDPAGSTNFGVTQRVYDEWRGATGQAKRSVRVIERAEVEKIYESKYWDAIHADNLLRGVDMIAFDIAVNSGPGRANEWLLSSLEHSPVLYIKALDARRRGFWRHLPAFQFFGKGWFRREDEVFAQAMKMAQQVGVLK